MIQSLPVTISKIKRKMKIEVDADKFERVAAVFGLFNKDFLNSVDTAEKEFENGEIESISSLTDIV